MDNIYNIYEIKRSCLDDQKLYLYGDSLYQTNVAAVRGRWLLILLCIVDQVKIHDFLSR